MFAAETVLYVVFMSQRDLGCQREKERLTNRRKVEKLLKYLNEIKLQIIKN